MMEEQINPCFNNFDGGIVFLGHYKKKEIKKFLKREKVDKPDGAFWREYNVWSESKDAHVKCHGNTKDCFKVTIYEYA